MRMRSGFPYRKFPPSRNRWILKVEGWGMALVLLLLLAGVTAPMPGEDFRATPGEVLHSFGVREGFSDWRGRWAFDNTLGRHYMVNLGATTIGVFSRDGSFIKEWDLSDSEGRIEFRDAFSGSISDGALFVVGEQDFYVMRDGTIRQFLLTETSPGAGAMTLQETMEFAGVVAGSITAIDRDSDGSWWLLAEGDILNVNPGVTAIRSRITPQMLQQNITGGAQTLERHRHLAVDRITGDLYVTLRIAGETFLYRIDRETHFQTGRIAAPLGVTSSQEAQTRLVGAHHGVVMLGHDSSLAPEERFSERSFPFLVLPRITNFNVHQQGVLWTHQQLGNRDLDFDMTVDWGDTPQGEGRIRFQTEGGFTQIIFLGSLEGGSTTHSIPRSSLDDAGGEPQALMMLYSGGPGSQISQPQWIAFPVASYSGHLLFSHNLPSFVGLAETQSGTTVTWSWNGVAPMEAFDAFVEFADFVPFVGGKTYGIKEVQASGAVEIASDEDGSIAVSGGGEFILGPGRLLLELGGGIIQRLTTEGPTLGGGLLTAKVAGTVTQEAGIVELIPALSVLRSMRFFGSAFTWLDKRAKLTAAITVGLDSTTKVRLSEEYDLRFDGDIVAFLALGVAAAVDLIGGYAEVTAYGEGKGSARFTPGPSGLSLQELAVSFLVGGKIRAYLMERTFERVISFSTADGVVTPKDIPNEGLVKDSGWQYAHTGKGMSIVKDSMSMPTVLTPNPFDEFRTQKQGIGRVSGSQSFDHEVRVLGGIPSDASIHASANPDDDTVMVVWSQPIPGNPATQATDIWFSYFDGNFFSSPAPIHTDTRADFNPKVQFLAQSPTTVDSRAWVAIWERNALHDMQPGGDPEEDTETVIANLRPCWSWFDPVKRTWSEPVDFPIEGVNGFNVKFMTSPRSVVACWLESDTGDLLPWDLNAKNPSEGRIGGVRLRFANLYRPFLSNGPPWYGDVLLQGPWTLGEDDPNADIPDDIVEYGAVTSGPPFAANVSTNILITRLTDLESLDPFLPVMRQEHWNREQNTNLRLFSLQDNTPLTSNPQLDFTPEMGRLNARVEGSRLLVGSRSGAHYGISLPPSGNYSLTGNSIEPAYEPVNFAPDDPARPQGAAFQSYKLVPVPGVGPSVVFHQPDRQGNLKLHLASANRRVGPITHGSDAERHATAFPRPGGYLLTMYQQVPIRRTPVTKKIGDTEEEFLLVEEEELGYFSMSRRLVVTDLMAGRVRHRSGLFLPGHEVTLEATVHNVGDRMASPAPRMSIYAMTGDGDEKEYIPVAENIYVQPIPGTTFGRTLAGNDTAVREVSWVVPDDRFYRFILLVDPDNEVEEFDDSNNLSESTIPHGLPSEVAQWLLGRLVSTTTDLDFNLDGIIDAADIHHP